jgi:hypothetical protein
MHSTLANGRAFTVQSVQVMTRCSRSLTPTGLVLWPANVGTVSAMQPKHPQSTGGPQARCSQNKARCSSKIKKTSTEQSTVPQDIQTGVSLLVQEGEGNREQYFASLKIQNQTLVQNPRNRARAGAPLST